MRGWGGEGASPRLLARAAALQHDTAARDALLRRSLDALAVVAALGVASLPVRNNRAALGVPGALCCHSRRLLALLRREIRLVSSEKAKESCLCERIPSMYSSGKILFAPLRRRS